MSKVDMTPPKGEVFDKSVMRLNVDESVILDQIKANIQLQVPQLQVFQETSQPIAIVGGGWSLNDTLDELLELYFDGVPICALNGAANWLMDQNIRPSMQIIMDARPDNIEFLSRDIPRCRYFLASQCHPSLFEKAMGRDLSIFHLSSGDDEVIEKVLKDYYYGRLHKVPPAGSVGNTAMMLCRMLGYRFQHLFGIDSCYSPRMEHHAYPQPINDRDAYRVFWTAGREFVCSGWHASQAINFQEVVMANGDHMCLNVHGDGLIAHLVKTGATFIDEGKCDDPSVDPVKFEKEKAGKS